MNDVIKTIYERRAVRKFKEIGVSRELIEQIIDAGRMAPSAQNQQVWNFLVLSDKGIIKLLSTEIAEVAKKYFHLLEGVDLLASVDFIFHGAPVVIFITAPQDNDWAAFDVAMCAQNMMLAAKSLGLDTCPVGLGKYAQQTKMLSKLKVPKGEKIELAVIIGYGNEKPKVHKRKKNNITYLTP